MTPEFFIAIAAVVTLVGGIVFWLVRTGSSVGKALVELGICRSDVAKLQTDTQQLRDQSVRYDERMTSINSQLSKLDKIDQLAASVAALTASVSALTAGVERLERRVDQLGERHD